MIFLVRFMSKYTRFTVKVKEVPINLAGDFTSTTVLDLTREILQ